MFFRLGRIVTRYRWLIVGLWIVAIAIALPFAPQATQVLHSGGFVSQDFESEQTINLLVQKLHFNPTIVKLSLRATVSVPMVQHLRKRHSKL